MARPVKFPHEYYVRFDDDSNAALLQLAKLLKIKPAVLLRSLIINKLTNLKGSDDAKNIKIIQ